MLVSGDIGVILLIAFIRIWQCPSCHFIPNNWISCAGPLTLVCSKTSFWKNLDSSSLLKRFLCCVAPHNYVINILQVFGNFTLFQLSLDQSAANGGAVFPPQGSQFQVHWVPLHLRANYGLRSAARGIEKKRIGNLYQLLHKVGQSVGEWKLTLHVDAR